MKIKKNLLLLGMTLVIPLYGFAILNTVLAPWTFLPRNRLLLILLTLLGGGAMLLIARAALRHEAFLTRHARAVRVMSVALLFAAQLLIGSGIHFVPLSDCEACYYGAIQTVTKGQMSDFNLLWMRIMPNNFGLFVAEVLALRFMRAVPGLGDVSLYSGMVALNALLFAAGFWAMLRLVQRRRGGAGQAIFAANMALCLPMFYCTSELYTDALSMPFLMLALCVLTLVMEEKSERVAHGLALLAGVFVLVGMELRATVAIVAIAAAIVMALTCRPKRLLCLLTMLAVLAAGHAAFMRYRDDALGKEELERWSMPAVHWLVMGTPDRYGYFNGSFSSEDFLFARNIEDPQEREAALWEKLHERVYDLRYPDRMLSALSRKLLNTFGDGTYNLRQTFGAKTTEPELIKTVLLDDSPEHDAYRHVCTGIMLAQLLCVCAGMAGILRRRETDRLEALCAVHLVGIFLLLTVWETSARYFFHAVPVMLLFVTMGQQRIAQALAAGNATQGRKRT